MIELYKTSLLTSWYQLIRLDVMAVLNGSYGSRTMENSRLFYIRFWGSQKHNDPETRPRRLSALFPTLFPGDLLTALSEGLKEPDLMNKEVLFMQELGETYEFIFTYQGKRVYAKINLSPDNKLIIIYSAHRPLKGDKL